MICLNCKGTEFSTILKKGYSFNICKNCKFTMLFYIGANGVKARLAGKDPKLWAEFMEFWNMYPNHKGGSMQFIFEKHYEPNPVDLNKLKIILPLQIEDKKKKGFEMPMAKTYLNQKRWAEDPKEYGYSKEAESKKIDFKVRKIKEEFNNGFIDKPKADELLQNIRKTAMEKGFNIKEDGFKV